MRVDHRDAEPTDLAAVALFELGGLHRSDVHDLIGRERHSARQRHDRVQATRADVRQEEVARVVLEDEHPSVRGGPTNNGIKIATEGVAALVMTTRYEPH